MRGEMKMGRVSSVDKAKHTAKVKFEEVDGFVSYDLQVLASVGGDYALPADDTPVLCFLAEGRLGWGFVLGTFYTDADEPPLDNAGHRSIAGDDLRLGDPAADKFVALANLVKDELDKIKTELDNVQTGLSTHTHPYTDTPIGSAVTQPPPAPPYSVGYSPTEPKAEKVKAK